MKIENAGPRIGLAQIIAFEAALGAVLAQDYRDFLLEFNGGAPTPDIVDVPGASGSPTDLQVFFGINRATESSDLVWNLSLVADRIPQHRLVPIACDSGGNLFCLKVVRGVTSEVVYCDLDSAQVSTYFVAPSFGEFVQLLRLFDV